MNPSVACYPTPGKAKAERILEAFARGAEPAVEAAAAFYGVVGVEQTWREVRKAGTPYYYLDNAFFDRARGSHFRAAKNALQDLRQVAPAWDRLEQLKIGVRPWVKNGKHIVVCCQSDHFMREVAGWPGGEAAWRVHVLETLRKHTNRQIVVRHWMRDKVERAATLAAEMEGAHALVTHMSAAANEALIHGVPVFVTGPCVALEMGLSQLEQIESPRRPDGRHEWAARLAAKQWTVDEIRVGLAWRSLNG